MAEKIEFFESKEDEEHHYKKGHERIEEVVKYTEGKHPSLKSKYGTESKYGAEIRPRTLFEKILNELRKGYGVKNVVEDLRREYDMDEGDLVGFVHAAVTYVQLEREKETYTYKKTGK